MITKGDKNKARLKRHLRVRKKINGTVERPRLSVFRSSKHIYAQLIDDVLVLQLLRLRRWIKSLLSKWAMAATLNLRVKLVGNWSLNVRKTKATRHCFRSWRILVSWTNSSTG